MNLDMFITKLKNKIIPNQIFENPKKGTSVIVKITKDIIKYKRENSFISIPILSIFEVYNSFKGTKCTSSDLKLYKPKLFSKAGHSCNCTFTFLVLKELNLCDEILGKGVRNSPYYVNIKNNKSQKANT